jgi:hypothetical protein
VSAPQTDAHRLGADRGRLGGGELAGICEVPESGTVGIYHSNGEVKAGLMRAWNRTPDAEHKRRGGRRDGGRPGARLGCGLGARGPQGASVAAKGWEAAPPSLPTAGRLGPFGTTSDG